MSVFKNVSAAILENPNLHLPQIKAYQSAVAHYEEFPDFSCRESLIVMPTGTGKTGVMSILPFGLSNGRVLIITPGKIVRKTVFKSFDSVNNPENTFWYKQKVIFDRKQFPKSYLYQGFNPKNQSEKEAMINKLHMADIVVTNIHKIVGSNPEINLSNITDPDFFDMIIIDEAHHVAAEMWQQTLNHFKATKVIKLTATPFRGDRLEISNHPYDPIYEYTLGEAISDGLVKNVVKGEDIPGYLEFYDPNTNEKYNLEKAKQILGNDWVSKSIAMSETCSKQVINHSKEILNLKRKSYPNHQILAITCNEDHAQDVSKWFNECGLSCTYVSANLSDKEIDNRLNDYANGIYDVMVSIQMLGEGYDNPNISVISIFRPFKTMSPYAQAIGRGLRRIRSSIVSDIDNYCNVVYHQELGLESLWEYYKDQELYGEVIKKQLKDITEQLSFSFEELGLVEKKPIINRNRKGINESEDYGSVNIGTISSYKSVGLGRQDGFTEDAYQKYLTASYKLVKDLQDKTTEEIENINKMLSDGIIDEKYASILINSIENQSQDEFNQTFTEFHDIVISETLHKDFTNWLNQKVEEFFKISSLEKKGNELYLSNPIDNNKIDNIGYIVRNLYQSLYNDSKKNISTLNAKDFAYAKQRLIEKLQFYKEQYGVKNKEDLE